MITNTVTMEQGITITQLKGQAYQIAADGSQKLLAEGDVLPKGAVIMSPDGASFMGGGQSFNVQPASEQSEPAEEGDAPQLAQNGAAGTPDEINALQQAILGGADPTQAFEASAAGGAPAAGGGGIGGVAGASGNGGFVTIDRTGSATIAEATFDTTYNTTGEPPLGAAGEDEVFDLTPPTISVVAPDNTNDTTPTLIGTTDAPVGSIVTLLVTDANGNQQTLTAIVTPGGIFTVDVVTPLAEGSYTVTATVTDPAGNTGTATDDGSVDIDDPVDPVNDSYSFSYNENSSDRTVIGTVKATDPEGKAVTYSIVSGDTNGWFEIDPVTGVITLTPAGVAAVANDFEVLANVHDLVVGASDGVNTTNINVKLTELDVNEGPEFNPPVGENSYSFSYNENSSDRTVIGTVKATDPEGKAVTYSIVSGDTNGWFEIDPVTGVITLTPAGVAAVANDFEVLANVHDLVVGASDGVNTTNINVKLTELDVNEGPEFNPPVGENSYSFSYNENSSDRTVIGTVKATDPEGKAVTYSIVSGDTNGWFEIDPVTGVITLTPAGVAAVANDFEVLANVHDLVVGASDGVNTTNINVKLTELDVNEGPEFNPPVGENSYSFSYNENSSDRTVIGTVKATDPEGKAVTYSIVSGDTNGWFEIDPVTGVITLTPAGVAAVANDFEVLANVHDLVVGASDGVNTTNINVKLTELDVNEGPEFNPPVGENSYSFSYNENSSDRTVIGTVKATDPEGKAVTYSIVSGDTNGWFEIDPVTGVITLTPAGVAAVANDFEVLANVHDLVVGASDGVNTTNINVKLTELDVNEGPEFNPPVGENSYSFSYNENSSDRTVIGTVKATDPEGKAVTYSIVSGDTNGWFEIDPVTGVITLTPAGVAAVANDFEVLANVHDLVVGASDGVNTTNINVKLTELDVNEGPEFNPPVGENSYSFSYNENSSDRTVIGTVKATDPEGKAVTYSIVSGDTNGWFEIDPVTGVITLTPAGVAAVANDFEVLANVHDLVVGASDGVNTTNINVKLTELDVNEGPEFNPPVGENSYSFSYNENSSDRTVIGTVKATDPEGKAVTYSIVSGDTNGWFEIDPVTGVITLTPAGVAAVANDFEVLANVHDLVVGASDGVNTTNINVKLTELDVNEGPEFNPPVGENSYSFSYNENSSDRTVIGTVKATDPEGKAVTYSIVSGDTNGWFEIDPVTGVITLTPAGVAAVANDFEVLANVHDLVVGASDGVNTTNINVKLTELDVNEGPEFNPPVGENSYSFSYNENSSDRTVIGTVKATDPEGKAVTYSIVSGDTNGWFEIDPVTGVITLTPAGVAAVANDFEVLANVHDLVVGASDGVNTTNINVKLTELDVNEGPEFNPPVGENSYSFSYNENSSDRTVIGTVKATDPEGKAVTYSIVSGDTNGWFEIDPVTGVITLTPAGVAAVANDFEVLANVHDLVVGASDGVNTTNINVKLTELDVNEGPEFNPPVGENSYSFSYNENSSDRTVIGTVKATDPEGKAVTYSIVSGDTNGWFEIDPVTGVITLTPAGVAAVANDFEVLANVHDLVVGASDGVNTTNINVKLTELDVNEGPEFNPPVGENSYSFSYNENSSDRTVIGTVKATDPEGKAVTYSIVSGDTNGWFEIDPVTGVITLTPAGVAAVANDFEVLANVHDLVVGASDGVNTTNINVKLTELDVNEGPEFNPPVGENSYSFSYNENSSDRTVIGTVKATDPEGKAVTYSIVSGDTNGWFEIDPVTGVITLTPAGVAAVANDFEVLANVHDLVVGASDGVNTTNINVKLTELDVNEGPEFNPPVGENSYSFSYNENSSDRTVIGTVKATDPEGKAVTYSIVSGDTNGWFEIDPVTGVITLTPAGVAAVANDFEVLANVHDLVVGASDGVNTTNINVKLTELDVNEGPEFNPPVGENSYSFSYNENSSDRTVIGTVKATDPEGKAVTYSIVSGDTNGWFEIDPVTGVITLTPAGVAAVANDFEVLANVHDLVVGASDGVNTTNINVKLTELDVNEGPEFNPPVGENSYSFSYNENSSDRTVIGTVKATDPEGKAVTYSIVSGDTNGWFEIDPVTGVITLTPAGVAAVANDFEVLANVHDLVVGASDGVNTTNINVKLTELDVNEGPEFNPPVGENSYSFSYNENSSDRTVIGTVKATDPEGKAVTYSIVSGDTNGWFEIDPVTGVITLTPAGVAAVANDFEVLANVHDLVVGASDGVNTTNINVKLTELDVNEGPEFNPPVGENSYSFSYNENSSDRTVIGTVKATDPEGKAVTYSIVSGDTNGWFEIDPVTGVITLTPAGVAAVANDFEVLANVHDLVVGASDGVNTTNINVKLTELDVNEGPEFNPPVGENSYSFSYNENSSDRTVIGTVKATDPEGKAVTYSIVSGDTNGWFEIDPVTGVITLTPAGVAAVANDFEVLANVHDLVVGASDGVNTTNINVKLTELDVNEGPEFNPPVGENSYSFSYNENSSDRTVIGTVKATDPEGKAVTYSIVSGDTNGWFEIDPVTGVITLTPAGVAAVANDFEVLANVHDLVVGASDGVNTTNINVKLTELDVNEGPEFNPPVGENSYSFSYNENSSDRTVIGTVKATDPEGKAVTYSIVSGDTNGWFEIDPVTGVITLTPAGVAAVANDFEVLANVHDLVVGASDGVNTTNINVKLTELDVNEGPEFNPPVGENSYSFSYNENSSDRTVIGTVKATDPEGKAVTYSIVSGDTNGWFEIDPVTGVITLTPAGVAAVANDFEVLANVHDLVVGASDGVNTTNINVKLTELDVNEGPEFNPPVGENSYSFSYNENSSDRTVIGTVKATDPEGKAVTYSIVSGDTNGWFEIDPVTGVITLTPAGVAAVANDFEVLANVHDLVVGASDGVNTTNINVKLTELDVNEGPEFNPPVGENSYSFSYNENSSDRTVIGTVKATDPEGKAVTYSIVSGDTNGWFEIDPVTGVITLTPAGVAAVANDFEVLANVHDLVVGASDGVNTTNINVKLTELDVNEGPEFNPPVGENSYSFSYNENSSDRTVIGTVKATDPEGKAVTYSIVSGDTNGWFEIDPVTGVITLTPAGVAAVANDFEVLANVHDLVVGASDGVNTTNINVKLTELDVNEGPEFNPPVGENSYSFSYNENSSDRTVIGTVKATDPEGKAVTYSIVSGDTNGWFEIDPVTGVITLTPAGVAAVANDFEVLANVHDLVVGASDGVNTTNINVKLTELDVNEGPEFNPPVGENSYSFSYNENSSDRTVIGTVKATDPEGKAVTYSIVSGDTNGWFEIDPVTGVITLTPAGVAAVANDFEVLANVHDLVVGASDGVNTTNINVKLTELDVNEGPEFNPPVGENSYSFSYNENSSDRTVIGTVKATDPEGKAVTYSIVSGDTNGWFEIDPVTGVITLTPAGVAAVANDFEVLANVHDLVVGASDGVNTTNINVKLTELDVNEGPEFNPPVGENSYSFSYNENSSDRTVIGTVKATDPEGKAVTYSIVSGDTNGWFEIDPVTGVITLTPAGVAAVANDFEVLANVHDLVVGASDGVNTTNINVKLTELDVNEGPEFNPPVGENSYSFSYNENSSDRTVIGTVKATDPEGKAVTYSIVSGDTNGWFEIDPVTGVITLTPAGVAAVANDFEVLANVHDLVVGASDGVNTTNINVKLTELDVNEAPCASGGYAVGSEDTAIILTWGQFNASDVDANSTLSIKITSLPADGVLQYNGVTVTQAQINTGLTITKAEIDSGKLQFKPDLHESSDVAGNGSGNTLGNKAGDYASFNYQVSDGSSLSATGKFVVDIAAVADKPILTLNNFQTVASLDFEDVNLGGSEWRADISINSVQGASTVGVWNTLNSGGKVEVGTEKTYTGGTSTNKVMEIEANVGDKTLYTDINCEAGRFYQLGFDVAARLGNPATSDMTIKLVRLDASGNPISGTEKLLYNFDPTDSNWLRNQTISLPIDASGKYRLIFEAVNADSTGAILDNIKFQAVENKGYEDNFIKLSAINASFADKDGSETHSVTISGLMVGSILKDGAGKEVTVDATGKVDITTGWSLNSLMVKPPLHFSGDMKLLVTATAIETSNGSKESTVLELPVTVLPINDAPVIVSGVAVVSEEGLPGGLPDSIGNPSDQSNSKEMSGQLSISDEDGDALNVVLVKPIGVFSSGNQPVTWEGDNSKTLIAKAGGQTVAQITIDDAGNYKVTLLKPFDHPNGNGEKVLSFDVGVKVTAGGQSTNGKLTVIVEDDSPLAIADNAKVDIVVDSFKFSGVEASWSNVVGGKNLELFDGPDNDSAKDQVRWGGSSGDKSGYGFADNDAALNGEIPLNEEIKLGTFTHYNYPVSSGTAISGVTMNATFSITDSMGRVTPVTVTVNFNHNETPNDGADPQDIITIGTTTANFNFEGKAYSLEVLGFRDSSGNVVKTIFTNENASSSFDLIVKLVEGSGYQLPQTTGNVLANDLAGADGGLSVIGYGVGSSSTTYTNGVGVQVVGLYGVLTILANGAYTYQVTKNGSQIPADAREVFSYSVRDGDGDTTNSTLSISVNPVDSNGVPVHLPLTVDGTDLNDSILVRNGEDAANADRLDVSFGGNLLGEITTSSGGTDHVRTGVSYNKGSADQVISSGAGNDHVETGSGNDVIYAGKTGADGFGTDDSLQLTVDQLKNHHIMTGSLSGTDTMLNGDGLLLSVDVSSRQADVVNSGSGNDKIYGQSGSDILFGHTGNDYIDGGSHNDALRGGLGNDILIGGLGNDVLRGDDGADTFVWNKGDTVSGSLTKDYIMDFNKGSGTTNRLEGDKLDLSDLLDHDGSRNQDDLKSLLSVFQDNEGVHLQVKESSTAPVTQEIVLMNHTFDSLTGSSGITANQVIDYMLNNNMLDIDK